MSLILFYLMCVAACLMLSAIFAYDTYANGVDITVKDALVTLIAAFVPFLNALIAVFLVWTLIDSLRSIVLIRGRRK